MPKQSSRPAQSHRVSNADILLSNALGPVLARGLLDKHLREALQLFYAWYRHCEDVSRGHVAEHADNHATDHRDGQLDVLYSKTYAAIFETKFVDPVFEGIERAVNTHGWPVSVVLDVLDGFRMDVEGRSYNTVDDLIAYCHAVSASVCVGVAQGFGVDINESWIADRAADLGLAFQLTTIALHVMDDARQGRVYLPAALFLSGRASPDFILDPANRSAVIAATNMLLDLADGYYASADLAIGTLHWRLRCVTATVSGSYRVIANRIRWSENPWPDHNPARWWTKLTGAMAALAKLAFTALTPVAQCVHRIDHWTRSTDLRHRH